MSDAAVMQYTGFKQPQSPEKIKELLVKWQTDPEVWGAFDLVNNEFIGWFMLKKTICEFPEIGFMLPQSEWGKGYATEIANCLIDFAKSGIGAEKVIASVNINNHASLKVLNKLGMKKSETIPPEGDIIYFEKEL